MHPVRHARRREVLAAFLERLARAHEHDTAATGVERSEGGRSSLLLANACLRDLKSQQASPNRAPQIAVMGPTQVGKSTVVNLLVGTQVAEVSALAGFTVHPSAFALGLDANQLRWLEDFFPGWTRCSADALSAERLDAYALECVRRPDTASGLADGCVVWDTPDFDSLASGRYQPGVLEVAAMADLVVLVLTREKYSDLSVWRMLDLLAPLSRRLLICLNKSASEVEAVVVPALRARLQTLHASFGDVALLSLPLWPAERGPQELRDEPAVGALAQAVQALASGVERSGRPPSTQAFMRTHWGQWTAPLRAELAARRRWELSVRDAARTGLEAYRSEYLEHPQRYDSLRLAVAELLKLLEIPGLAASMMRLRRMLTWPARQLANAWRRRGVRGGGQAELSNEQRVLQDVLEQKLVVLARDVARYEADEQASAGFWSALDRRLALEQAGLLEVFQKAASAHQQAFAVEIQASARRLYERLQEHPALLNTLRATRASADAAAIALAVKLGGVGINDLLFAPALISVTSLLTEGALGSYVQHEAARLKQRQSQIVEQQVFDAVFIPALLALADDLEGPGVLSMPAEELEAAEAALEELAHA